MEIFSAEQENEVTFAEAKSLLMQTLEDAEFEAVETVWDDDGDENIGLRFSNGALLVLMEYCLIREVPSDARDYN